MKDALTKIRQIALMVSGWNIDNVRDEMLKIIDLCDEVSAVNEIASVDPKIADKIDLEKVAEEIEIPTVTLADGSVVGGKGELE